jgi:hypothetical protein
MSDLALNAEIKIEISKNLDPNAVIEKITDGTGENITQHFIQYCQQYKLGLATHSQTEHALLNYVEEFRDVL